MEHLEYKKHYYIEQCQKTLTFSRVTAPIAAIIICGFLYQDIYILKFDFTLYWRLLGIAACLLYFIFSLTILKTFIRYTIPLYSMTLLLGIIMILGIAYQIFTLPMMPETHISNTSAGIQTVLIIGFIISIGAMRYLPYLLTIPLTVFLILLAISGHLSKFELSTLSNPITTAIFVCILAYLYEKRNYTEFTLHHKLKINDELLNQYKNRTEKELAFASKLHRDIMPATPPVHHISVYFRPYHKLGGDFYDFTILGTSAKDKIGIFISDVAGHGISSAFITALMKHYLVIGKKYYLTPHKLMYYLNEYLCGTINPHFVTAFYCIVDVNKKELTYSNASHYPPIIIDSNGNFSEPASTGKTLPLGIMSRHDLIKHKKSYSQSTIQLKEKSKLILFTDGIIELYNSKLQTTVDRKSFNELLRKNHHLPHNEMIKEIEKYITENYNNDYINDDMCVIVVDI